MILIEEISNIFSVEAEKLESAINAALEKSELTIPDIVQTYYQTMSCNSLRKPISRINQ